MVMMMYSNQSINDSLFWMTFEMINGMLNINCTSGNTSVHSDTYSTMCLLLITRQNKRKPLSLSLKWGNNRLPVLYLDLTLLCAMASASCCLLMCVCVFCTFTCSLIWSTWTNGGIGSFYQAGEAVVWGLSQKHSTAAALQDPELMRKGNLLCFPLSHMNLHSVEMLL